MRYAELHCHSNFSFLRGASHPVELVQRAAELGYEALALTDRNSLAGVVRAHVAVKEIKSDEATERRSDKGEECGPSAPRPLGPSIPRSLDPFSSHNVRITKVIK